MDIHLIEKTEQEDDEMLAFFSTCALATHDHCYLQDDRTLNLHMDSLYTQFMRYPDLVHVNARLEEFLTHRRWRLHHQGKASLSHFYYYHYYCLSVTYFFFFF